MSDAEAVLFIFSASFLGGLVGGFCGVLLAWRFVRERAFQRGNTGL